MVGWLYTNSLVFFLSPFAMCYDNEVLFMHITFLLEEEEFGTCNPTFGSGPLCFVFHITLLDFFLLKKTYKGGGTFQYFLKSHAGDPKGFVFKKTLVEVWWTLFLTCTKRVS